MIRYNIFGTMIEPGVWEKDDRQEWLRAMREIAARRPLKPGESGSFSDWFMVYLEETVADAVSFEDALVRRHRTTWSA